MTGYASEQILEDASAPVRAWSRSWLNSLRTSISWNAYRASLIATAVMMPTVAAVLTVTLYCIHARWWFAFAGAIVAVITWAGFAVWYARYTTPSRANATVYDQLTQRHAEIALRYRETARPPQGDPKACLYADMGGRLNAIEAQLRSGEGDLRWVAATGYINLWKGIHRLDEDLLKFHSPQRVAEDARYDRDRITGSTIPDGQSLLQELQEVEKAISPTDATAPLTALETLIRVRQKINEFRDTGREGLLEARNRIVVFGIITGLALDALVGLAIAEGVGVRQVASAAAFFLAGGLVGLFKRLNEEFQTDSDVEDYCLSTARAIVVPLLSGIAGMFGVLFILIPGALSGSLPIAVQPPVTTPIAAAATATATSATAITVTPVPATAAAGTANIGTAANLPTHTATLTDIFDMERYPLEIIVAAVFGFAPSLFANKLQEQVDGYKAGLKSSQLSSRPEVVKNRIGTSTTASG